MQDLRAKMYLKWEQFLNNEKGAQSLEWIGVAAVLLMIVGLVSNYMGGDGADAIKDILGKLTTKISDMIK